MEESHEQQKGILPSYSTNQGWRYEGRRENGRLIIDATLKWERTTGVDEEDIHEHGEYEHLETDEIPALVYVMINEKSSPGSLPGGDACYIPGWDVILIQPEAVTLIEGKLSPRAFTILAHEVGHRLAHKRGLAKLDSDETFDRDEEEALAWRLAIETFGSRPNFDHGHAQKYFAHHQARLEKSKQMPSV